MIKELLDDHMLFHSKFQMDNFITGGSGCTPYGRYKQALRELYKRLRGMRDSYAERELLRIDIEELASTEVENKYEKRRAEVRLTQMKMKLEELERTVSDTMREFNNFYSQAVALKNEVGDISGDNRDRLERGEWKARMERLAAIDCMTAGRVTKATLEMALSMPVEDRRELFNKVFLGDSNSKRDFIDSALSSHGGVKAEMVEAPDLKGLIEWL